MIYVDTSVVLAAILAEDRAPAEAFWRDPGIASRLLHYEVMNRLHAYRAEPAAMAAAEALIAGLVLVEFSPVVLARALEPFPVPVRTLDALHLATALYFVERRARTTLATYDQRMAAAATAVGLEVIEPA